MNVSPQFESIQVEALLGKVGALRSQGYRLVQICATRLPEQLELTYSFDLEGRLLSLRLNLTAIGAQLPSITPHYWCAFLYENEMHDLFDIQVNGMAVDFHGTLYKTSMKFPFGTVKAPGAPTPAPTAPPSLKSPTATPSPSPAMGHPTLP